MGLRAVVLVALACGLVATPARAQIAASDTSTYAWAAACKDCHQKEYDSWAKTKHDTALKRLSGGEREQACIGCHVTGSPSLVQVDGKPVNGGVQCESCHGAGKAHIAAAAGGAAKPGQITRMPAASVCEQCHNAKSPHFKFFSFDAMKGLVHVK